MQHSIEELIRRINAMHDLAVQAHRVRNEYSDISNQEYDKQRCKHLIEQVQAMALGIANDNEGDEIKTEMEYKNVEHERV
tara:strand:+ start:3987 stop:4226 length:240 start_codon:yes stop_codon:yes gene_type:complete